MVHGLSRPAARGIFPDQGSNLCVLHWQADSLSLGHQGSRRCRIDLIYGWQMLDSILWDMQSRQALNGPQICLFGYI